MGAVYASEIGVRCSSTGREGSRREKQLISDAWIESKRYSNRYQNHLLGMIVDGTCGMGEIIAQRQNILSPALRI